MRRGFADPISRHEAAPIAFQADKGGGERTRFREELPAILALEAALHHHDRGLVRTGRFDGSRGPGGLATNGSAAMAADPGARGRGLCQDRPQ